MKPIKLTIQAFGPFAGTEVIDFTKLGTNPLFLINGPTGAGKSSILDAICFALYGQTTETERDASQMRCDHSALSLLTEVSLEFTLGNKRYLIRRVPTQERAKSRGEGTTIQQAEAQLHELGELSASGKLGVQGELNSSEDNCLNDHLIVSKSVAEATAEIQQLIGLRVEQFRQVIVLPQGKFRELLMADSKQRESIFSQLFQTQIYKKIENKLKEKASAIKKDVENHQNQIKGILQAAEVTSETAINEELEELQPKLKEAKTARDNAESLKKSAQQEKDHALTLNQRFDNLAKREVELREKALVSEEFTNKQVLLDNASKAQNIYHLYTDKQLNVKNLKHARQQYENTNKKLMAVTKDYNQAFTLLEKAKKAAETIDPLKLKKAELKHHEILNGELSDTKTKLKENIDKVAVSKKRLEDTKKEQVLLAEELSQKETKVVKYLKDLESLVPEQVALDTLIKKLEGRKELTHIAQNINALTVDKTNGQKELEEKNQIFENAKRNARKTELTWHTGQAALLAAELEENKPCPVCGSKEHPEPAKLALEEKPVTKQQVEKARQLENKAQEAVQNCKESVDKIDRQLEILSSKYKTLEVSLDHYSAKTVDEIESEQKSIQKCINELITTKTEKKALEKRIQKIKQIQSNNNEKLSRLEAQANEDNTAVIQVQTKVEQLEKQIPDEFLDTAILDKALKEVTQTINELTLKLNNTEATFSDKQSELDQVTANEKTLSVQLIDQKEQSSTAESTWQIALSNSDFESIEQFLDAKLDDKQLERLRKEIERYRSELDNLKGAVDQLKAELKEKQRPNLDKIEQFLTEKTTQFQAFDNTWRGYEARANALKSVKSKLIKAHSESADLEKQYTVIGTLNEVASGATGDKINLQRFVLSVLLDDMLIEASHRLHIMSKGRYRLIRKEDRAKGNKASGLELEVEDGNTGKSRSVATLSGGESFMAALSLALGLSDVVQSYAGGIRLDTLFIDEGFGSLDSESLEAAIRVLVDLQSNGRMIGIISHVSELKEQMALRLDVISGRTGSRISTIAA